MGEHQSSGRPEVGAGALNPGVQGLLSFGDSEGSEGSAGESEASEGSGESEGFGEQLSAAAEPASAATHLTVVRVLPDVVRLEKVFDYVVPEAWHADGRAQRLQVGSIVRINLGRRRLRAWIVEIGVEPVPGVKLQPLLQITGMGPPADMLDLARWAARRWAGTTVSLLRTASPPRVVRALRPLKASTAAQRSSSYSSSSILGSADQRQHLDGLFSQPDAVTVFRNPPAGDVLAVAQAATRRGDALIIAPGLREVRRLTAGLQSQGVRVAQGFDDWAVAAAGATVVGTRTAVWLPMPRLAAVVVVDEHSENLQSEQAPTWHARDVALQRARIAAVPAVLMSPVPTLEALQAGDLVTAERSTEIAGWPEVRVLDRRNEDPVRGGLFAEGLRDLLVSVDGQVAVILNRKGRGRLLACRACGEIARSSDGRTPMRLIDDELTTADGSERRPVVCVSCGSTVLRILRSGVKRAREELAALAGEPVGEVSAETAELGTERILIGTESVLWRMTAASLVVYLDFDQELLATRQRASEQALALLARGARLAGARSSGGRLVIQTRQPQHPVIQAAVKADPTLGVDIERCRRQALGLPPFGAQARVSGAGAEAFVTALRHRQGELPGDTNVSVLGPFEGSFLLRAASHDPLLDLLAATPRPAERLRVEVDPLRV